MTVGGSPTVLCVAGEASGDALLAPVVACLRSAGIRCLGTGGDACATAGLEVTAHIGRFTAHGLVEALPALPEVVRAYRGVCARLADARAVLLVDAPELNLRVLRRAADENRPVIWLAPPQIWAWRARRAQVIGRADALLCTLPFERDAYHRLGLPAEFVGHPLAETTFSRPPIASRGLAILPGSRLATARRLRQPMFAAARSLREAGVIDRAHLGHAATLPPLTSRESGAAAACPSVMHEGAVSALNASTVALAAFGTVTLEAALAGRPLVTAGRLHPLTAAVAARLVRVPHLALPNLVLGERHVTELWQEAVTTDALTAAVRSALAPDLEEALARAEGLAHSLRTALRLDGPSFGQRVAARVLRFL